MELKSIAMTDEYAAHYFYQMGWMACRLAYKLHEEAEEAGALQSMTDLEEDTIKCSRCEESIPESEAMEVGSWWVCGICYDDI